VNPDPIFIFGNQKSGTSAISALLGEATSLSYTIDILCLYNDIELQLFHNQCSFDDFINKAKYYFSKDIIKDPGFTFFYHEIVSRFPHSKRVFILRDPRQNIRSILNRLSIPGDLDDLSPQDWHKIQHNFPNWYHILEGSLAGHKGNNYIETLALRCQKCFQIYQEHKSELIPIYYENFNRDKIREITNLAIELGLLVTRDISHVKDVQFQPRGNSNESLYNFFGTRNLQIIEEICSPEMKSIGYEI
jgi:hypothetical protein